MNAPEVIAAVAVIEGNRTGVSAEDRDTLARIEQAELALGIIGKYWSVVMGDKPLPDLEQAGTIISYRHTRAIESPYHNIKWNRENIAAFAFYDVIQQLIDDEVSLEWFLGYNAAWEYSASAVLVSLPLFDLPKKKA